MHERSKVKIITKNGKTDVYDDGERINKITDINCYWDSSGVLAEINIKKIVDIELEVDAKVNQEMFTFINKEKYKLVKVEDIIHKEKMGPKCPSCGSMEFIAKKGIGSAGLIVYACVCKKCDKLTYFGNK